MRYRPAVRLAIAVLIGAILPTRTTAQTRPLPPPTRTPTPQTYAALADEVERHLHKHVLEAWFPRCIDRTNGGFHLAWARDWTRQPGAGKGIVTQARMTWIAARVAVRRPALREQYVGYARHGLDFLERVMWDKEHGGFHWRLTDAGTIAPSDGTGNKHLYGIAFGIYASAAAFEATQDPRAKDLAVRAFEWVEAHCHDDAHGGYHEYLTREGEPILPDVYGPVPETTPIGGSIGYKSMNTHIHLLEAYTQLYRVWTDERLKGRLEELLRIVRDKVAVEPGVLNLWFTPDWRPTADHDSFGHDIETAYLLDEAAHALGRADDPTTLRVERLLVDHTLALGFDPAGGGVYNKGTAFHEPYDKSMDWWGQFESLNALLMMHERYGRDTDRYWSAFLLQWRNIADAFTDAQFDGIYERVGADGEPDLARGKGHNWKAAYHDGRALIEVSDRLRRMSGGGGDGGGAGVSQPSGLH